MKKWQRSLFANRWVITRGEGDSNFDVEREASGAVSGPRCNSTELNGSVCCGTVNPHAICGADPRWHIVSDLPAQQPIRSLDRPKPADVSVATHGGDGSRCREGEKQPPMPLIEGLDG